MADEIHPTIRRAMEVRDRMDLVLADVLAERIRQDDQWGEQNHADHWWHLILTEEVGEVAQAVLHDWFGGPAEDTVREELVQVAAVALSWLEAIDRRRNEEGAEIARAAREDYLMSAEADDRG